VAEGATREPGVILSFDDAFVADWLAAMPLFERYKAHVTFFISHFERLTPEQIDGLHRIERAGHAIECHGLRHERAATYCREHSLEQWLECEVQPAVAWMRQEGFEPTAFAYPCSENDDQTDRALLGVFRHIRTNRGPEEGQSLAAFDPVFAPADRIADRGCIIAKRIDRTGPEELPEIEAALERAAARRECVAFNSHNISDMPQRNYVTPWAVEAILRQSRELGLAFHTVRDL